MTVIRIPFHQPVTSVSTNRGRTMASNSEPTAVAAPDVDHRESDALATLERLESLMTQLQQTQQDQVSEMRSRLITVAIEVCRQALGEDGELLHRRVQHFADLAIQQMPQIGTLKLTAFVHPSCLSKIQEWSSQKEISHLHCKPDATLEPGDCRIESDGKGISASLDAFLDAATINLAEARSS